MSRAAADRPPADARRAPDPGGDQCFCPCRPPGRGRATAADEAPGRPLSGGWLGAGRACSASEGASERVTKGRAGPGLPRPPPPAPQGPFPPQRQQGSLSLPRAPPPPFLGPRLGSLEFPRPLSPPPGLTVLGSPGRARRFEVEPPPGPRGSPPPPQRPETQPFGVVGLRGWWGQAEGVSGPSPTLARRRETEGAAPTSAPPPRVSAPSRPTARWRAHSPRGVSWAPTVCRRPGRSFRASRASPARPPGESPQHPLILRLPEVCPGCAQVRKLEAPLV